MAAAHAVAKYITLGDNNYQGNSTNLSDIRLLQVNFGQDNLSWQPYAASCSTFTVGNGSLSGIYTLIGKTCFVKIYLTFGSTSSFSAGQIQFSVPFTAASDGLGDNIGSGDMKAAGALKFITCGLGAGGTTVVFGQTAINEFWIQAASYAWANGDFISLSLVYQTA